jgi:oligoendopeptidase F
MALTHVPTRNEIDPQHTWNDTSVYATVDEWLEELEGLSAELDRVAGWQGHLAEGPRPLLDALHGREKLVQRAEKALIYAYLAEAVDTTDQAATQRIGRGMGVFGRLLGALAFIEPEILAIGHEQLAAWAAAEPRLRVYDHYFDDLFRRQAHVRSPEIEEALGLAADAFQGPTGTYAKLTDSDFQFAPARAGDGGELPVTQGSIDDLLASPDRETRRTAWESYHDKYLEFRNTLAANLATSIKQNVLGMRIRRYPTTLDMALFDQNIPTSVFHNLIDTFKAHRHVWQRYFDVRRRALGVEKLHTYDIWAPLTTERPHVPYEQAVEWIAAALAPLGDEYVATLRRGCHEDRWVDVYPNQGKAAGAFSSGCQGMHPFIVMSYTDDALSMGTLAHELGHSMHSWQAWETQPKVYADYSLFAAEVASNFHQAMLRAYLLDQEISRDLKIAVIEEAMSNFHRYFLIMPTLATFELEMHQRVERGEGLAADAMNDTLADLFAESYGDAAVVDRARDGIRWATFGHLYADYYVFQYATGISGANALARRVLSGGPGAAEDYLGFLRAGGSQYPLDALKSAGVDLATPAPVETAFGVLADLVERLDGLVN